VNIISLS